MVQKKAIHPNELAQLQKLGWHIAKHWHEEGQVTQEGFVVLYQMLWGQYEPDHGQALLSYAKQQRELRQQQSTMAETETYREWLSQASLKGHRGLFRSLKKDEQPYLRPFQQLPREERMQQRIQQWGAIWGTREEQHKVTSLQAMIQKGKEHASHMKPITEKEVWKTIKLLSTKAPGLDGVGFDFLKALPYSAMKDIVDFYHQVEEHGTVPNQWLVSLIAMLPKSTEIERPIALVATMYRLWCRIRNSYTKEWQSQVEDEYPWERAVPGTECLQVALKRAFLTEHHHALKKTVVSVLLDMSNFYDRINLQKLAERWMTSNYPGTHASFAMQIYCGTRILEAEGEASTPMWTTNGILAGDPQAPLAAKIYLQRALKSFCKKYPFLHVDLWIDDLSFDVIERDTKNAVRIAIQAYTYIKELLEEDDLKISEKKTGFVASNVEAKRLLQQQLPPGGPQVHDIMRDLGVDCTAGRLRRIKTMKQRRKKAGNKLKKMNALKIPQRAIRLKLYKGSIQAGISWGHQSMGLAPQTRQKLKAAMARQMGLQRTGNIDVLFDMQPRHQDPAYEAFVAQIKVYHKFFGNWPEHLHRDVEKAWKVTKERLSKAKYPWQVARGPVAALLCYLQDHGWQTDQYDLWTKPGANGEDDFTLNMRSSWHYLKEELARAQVRERVQSFQKRQALQDIQQPLNWLPWRRLDKQSNNKTRTALQTWHQGAIFTKTSESQAGKRLICPHCQKPADAIHLLWQCKETNRHFPPIPEEAATEMEQGLNMEFWSQGLLQRPAHQLSTGGAAIQAWGSWTGLDEISLRGHDALTIGIATTSADSRLRYYVVTILHHTIFGGEMYRMGAISTVLPGRQTRDRACYYALRMIAHYVDLTNMVRVHALSVKAWQAWVKGHHYDQFHDLANLVTWDQRQRIRALSVTQKQISTMPATGLSLRNRYKDANRAAMEFALSKQPHDLEQEYQEQDQRYKKYAPMAAERIRYLLETQDYFLHGEKAKGKELR